MSMIGNFRTTCDLDIDALLERPQRIELMLYGEYFSDNTKKKGIFSFFRKRKDEPHDNWKPIDIGKEIDVDKAWHGIHYLLTGKVWDASGPEAFIVSGGIEIGDVDVGYGPSRAFKSKEVKKIARRLRDIEKNKLIESCDKNNFSENEIYPEIWDEEPESCFGYILEHFEALKHFVSEAAEDGKALIVYIN
ncbi:MAG: YfbM family protein [Desulfobacterales bacterium]|nr:YfbM family protein [Desulfobacterales bacterium]